MNDRSTNRPNTDRTEDLPDQPQPKIFAPSQIQHNYGHHLQNHGQYTQYTAAPAGTLPNSLWATTFYHGTINNPNLAAPPADYGAYYPYQWQQNPQPQPQPAAPTGAHARPNPRAWSTHSVETSQPQHQNQLTGPPDARGGPGGAGPMGGVGHLPPPSATLSTTSPGSDCQIRRPATTWS